jgi:hypothetical protein
MRAHYILGLRQHLSWTAGQVVGAASEMLGKRALAWDTPLAVPSHGGKKCVESVRKKLSQRVQAISGPQVALLQSN